MNQLFHAERPQSQRLHWPELDIDLEIDAIRHPERFPLVAFDEMIRGKRRIDIPLGLDVLKSTWAARTETQRDLGI